MGTCLLTNCLGGMGGGEIALLRHLDYSRVPPDRLTVAVLNPGPLVEAVRARGVACEVVGREGRDGPYPGPGETLQIAWRLAGLIRRRRVTSVLCYTIQDLQAAMWARRFLRFRLAWRSQGEATVTTLLPEGERRLSRHLRAVRRSVDLVLPTTARDADELVRRGAIADRVRTVYLGVDDTWFSPRPLERAGPCRFVFSGRLVPWKGQRTFLQAFALARAGHPEAEAWLIGGGDATYEAALREEACRLGIQDRTRFFGHRDDVRELVRQCDIAVHCSEREPFGLVIIEAMACGLPVIAADVQGPREIIRPGETGFLAPAGDAGAFAGVLRRLLEDEGLRRSVGVAGRAEAYSRFRAKANTVILEDLWLAGVAS